MVSHGSSEGTTAKEMGDEAPLQAISTGWHCRTKQGELVAVRCESKAD